MIQINFLCLFLCLSCARLPLEDRTQSMRTFESTLLFNDHFPKETLLEGIDSSINRLRKSKGDLLHFGSESIAREDYIFSLQLLKILVDENWHDKDLLSNKILEHFRIFEVYGQDKWGEVLVTGYYTPVINGAKKRTPVFQQALYKRPNDMVDVHLGSWREVFEEAEFTVNGKDIFSVKGRLRGSKVLPYFSREEIDSAMALKDRGLELAYVDPVEAFFLQIQGSGKVVFKNGKSLYLHYHDQNGHRYHAIGKELLEFIPKEEMSMQKIKEYLRSLQTEEKQKILNTNPSYVFFHAHKDRPKTYFNTEVIDHRTVATDENFFPKGAIGFLQFDSDQMHQSRFIVDHDRGGAIRGGGRLDLYMGEGQEAEIAGKTRSIANLYYLLPKKR